MIAHAIFADGPLPSTVDDPRWATTERTDVRLRNAVTPAGEWAHPPTVRAVSFRILYNQEAVAFRFTWDDSSQDLNRTIAGLPDGFALSLKPSGSQGDVVSLQAWPYAGSPQLDLCYWSADTNQASETVAMDWDHVLQRQSPQALLKSVSHYDDGRWFLVLQRPLHPVSPEGAAAIVEGRFASVGLAVWDGANANARAVSPWVDLVLRRTVQPVAPQESGTGAVRVAIILGVAVLVLWLVLRNRATPRS